MFLKLKQESSGTHIGFRVRPPNRSTSRTTGAQKELFRQDINFQKFGAKVFGETKIELDVGKIGSKSEQDPGNPCDLSERFI